DCLFFFFQAEDGIRDRNVTGVQTCSSDLKRPAMLIRHVMQRLVIVAALGLLVGASNALAEQDQSVQDTTSRIYVTNEYGGSVTRSEERRVGEGGESQGTEGRERKREERRG